MGYFDILGVRSVLDWICMAKYGTTVCIPLIGLGPSIHVKDGKSIGNQLDDFSLEKIPS